MSKLNPTRIVRRLQLALWPVGSAVVIFACAATSVMAATPEQVRGVEAQLRIDRAACLDGSSHQDRTTCLYETRSVQRDVRRGTLETGESQETLMRNAVARCAAVAEEDRKDCERLARGEGEQSGSVAAGGIFKQLVTRTVGPTPAPVPAPAPAPRP